MLAVSADLGLEIAAIPTRFNLQSRVPGSISGLVPKRTLVFGMDFFLICGISHEKNKKNEYKKSE